MSEMAGPGRSLIHPAEAKGIFPNTANPISDQTIQSPENNRAGKRITDKDVVGDVTTRIARTVVSYPRELPVILSPKFSSGTLKPLDGQPTDQPSRKKRVSVLSISTRSERDIELENLPTARPYSTYSTDQLIRPLSSSTSLGQEPCSSQSHWRDTKPENGAQDQAFTVDEIPNYRPVPLRWPFCIFLLAVLAGLFAFLEFEMNNLPPLHYKLLPIHNSIRVPNITDATEVHLWEGDELPDGVNGTILDGRGLKTTLARREASPEPVPEPRPPEDSYPKPFTPLNTYCGWAAPTWRVNVVADSPSLTASSPIEKSQTPSLINMTVLVEEIIDTFTTDNPSWCPCRIGDLLSDLGPDSIDWAMNWPGIPPNPNWYQNAPLYQSSSALLTWDSHDQGCQSAMYAISSFRSCKRFQFETALVTSQPNSAFTLDAAMLGLPSTQLTTPPAQLKSHPDWQYASMDGKGNVAIPLVRRVAGSDLVDVFGNFIKSTDTALYPERWTAELVPYYPEPGSTWYVDNPCIAWPWTSRYTFELTCSPTNDPSEPSATTWWTLPLSSPGALPPTTATETMSATSNGVLSSTTPEPGSIVSAPSPPSTTCCSPDTFRATGVPGDSASQSLEPTKSLEIFLPVPLPSEQSSETTSTRMTSPRETSSNLPDISTSASSANRTPVSNERPRPTLSEGSRSSESSITTPTTALASSTETAPISEVFGDNSSVLRDNTARVESKNDSQSRTTRVTMNDEVMLTTSGSTATATEDLASTDSATLEAEQVLTPTSPYSGLADQVSITTQSNPVANTTSTAKSSSRLATTPVWILPPGRVTPLGRPFQPHGPIPSDAASKYFNLRSETDYLMVSVIPVLLATILLMLLQILTTSVHSVLPFRALGRPQGSLAQDSLTLSRNPNLLSAPVVAARHLVLFKDPLPLLATLLGGFAVILVTLSSEVIRIDVTTDCNQVPATKTSFKPVQLCALGLRKSTALMRIAEGLIIALAVLVIGILIVVSRWESGLAAEPWSIASMTAMICQGGELQQLLRSTHPEDEKINIGKCIRQAVDGRRYRMGFATALQTRPSFGDGISEARSYGIQVIPTATEDDTPIHVTTKDIGTRSPLEAEKMSFTAGWNIPAIKLPGELLVRVLALLFTVGLLNLILNYETTVGVDTGFEEFMNSQTIGARILFAAFGTVIDAFWSYYYSYTSESQIHQLLAKKPHQASTSILLSPPSNNIFVGLWRAMSPTNLKQDLMSFNIALASFFAKFTPIVLSQIPFSNAVTWRIHEVCTWITVAFLSHMVLVLFISGSHAEKENRVSDVELHVKTDTIAGCLYYLYDSRMVADFEGLSMAKSRAERDRLVIGMGRWYCLKSERSPDNGSTAMGMDSERVYDNVRRVKVDYVQST
ncbi:hypothetical protein V8F20_001238 [Naviculisporaceae sp. PSN 640]